MKTLTLLLLFVSINRARAQRFIGGSLGFNAKMERVVTIEAGQRFGRFTALADVRGADALNYGIGAKVGASVFKDVTKQRPIYLIVGSYYDRFVWDKNTYREVRPAVAIRIQDYSGFYEFQYSQNTIYFTIGYQWRKKK